MLRLQISQEEGNRIPGDDINLRQQEILKLVVSGFISSSQPISSLHITENYNVGLSSATIRSIFAELEQKGYLYSPHRSSGRIPTEKGYRFYVGHLPDERCVIDEDRMRIQEEFLKREFGLDEILDGTCRILSMLTNYAGVVLGPQPEVAVLKHIELIDMGEDEVLVVLVTRSGTVYSKTIFMEQRIPASYLQQISRYLNHLLKGSDLRDVRAKLMMDHEGGGEMWGYMPMIARTINANFDLVKGSETIYTSGLDTLYAQVARGEMERMKALGNLFESGEFLRGVFRRAIELDDVFISIEGDRDPSMEGISIVTASYKMGEKKIGSLGIIGPNRMDYVRVINLVEYLSLLISTMITRMSN